MMSAWGTITAVLEARSGGPLRDLLDYVSARHGEHEADELRDFIQSHPFPEVRRHVATRYMDDQADALATSLGQMMGGGREERPREPSAPAGGRSHDKGSGPSEPIPQRPAPAAGDSPLMRPSPAGRGHDVGSAGLARKPQSPEAQGAAPRTTGVSRPDHPGDFVGQRWQPSAYSAPEPTRKNRETGETEPGEMEALEAAIERESEKPRPDMARIGKLRATLGILQRRSGGYRMRPTQHGSLATGQMVRGAAQQDPSRPGSVTLRRGKESVPWEREHPGWYWAGPEHGWVSHSEYVSLVGAGKVRPQKRRLSFSEPG